MKEVCVCTACLATDVRMYSMSAASLLEPYRLLTGREMGENIPQKLCWECAALVHKFNMFRHKCERASLLLQDIYNQHEEHYEQNLRSVDRNHFNLTSKYSVWSLRPITLDPQSQTVDESYNGKFIEHPTFPRSDVFVEIKTENSEFDSDHHFADLETVKTEHLIEDRKIKKHKSRHEDFIKQEFVPDFNSLMKEYAKVGVVNQKSFKSRKERKKREKAGRKDAGGKEKGAEQSRAPNKKIDCTAYATEVMLTQEQQMEEVRRRQESVRFQEARFKCVLCFKGYIDEKTFKNHLLKHDPVSGQYQCDVCKSRFKQRRHVVNHIYKVHMSKYHCKFCPYISQSPEQASNHNKWHTGVTYKCDMCGEIFTKRSTHLSHVRIKHPSQHICGACGESFVSERGLVLHASLMHKDSGSVSADAPPGPYCSPCGVQFTTLAAWQKHVLISPQHTDDRQFLPNGCRDCGENLPTVEELRQHQRSHVKRRRRVLRTESGVSLKFPTQCGHCSETVESASQYWQHFRRAHPDQKYPAQTSAICEYCGKGFQTNALLVYHRYTHTGKRSYQCSACPKSFYTPNALTTHTRSHDDSRPHVCTICRKGFKVKPALARHVRIHTGEKPYACEVCGKAFSDASSRKLHVRTVHLKEPTQRHRQPCKREDIKQPYPYQV